MLTSFPGCAGQALPLRLQLQRAAALVWPEHHRHLLTGGHRSGLLAAAYYMRFWPCCCQRHLSLSLEPPPAPVVFAAIAAALKRCQCHGAQEFPARDRSYYLQALADGRLRVEGCEVRPCPMSCPPTCWRPNHPCWLSCQALLWSQLVTGCCKPTSKPSTVSHLGHPASRAGHG